MDFNSHNPVISSEENEIEDDNQVLLGNVQEKKVQFQPPPQKARSHQQIPQRFIPAQHQQQQHQLPNQWNQQQQQQQLPQSQFNHQAPLPQQQQQIYYPHVVQPSQYEMNAYPPQLQQHTVQFPPSQETSTHRIRRKKSLTRKFVTILILHLVSLGVSNLLYGLLLTFFFVLCLISSIFGFAAGKKKSSLLHGIFIGISIIEIFIFVSLYIIAFPFWAGGISNEHDQYRNHNGTYTRDESHIHVFVFIGYFFFVLAGILKMISVAQSVKLVKKYKKEQERQENIHVNNDETVQQPQHIHQQQFTTPMNVQPQQYIPHQQHLQFPQQNYSAQNISSAPVEEESQPSLDQLQNQFGNEVRLLSEMGFDNTERNLYLLHKNNGNIQSVVQDYIKNY